MYKIQRPIYEEDLYMLTMEDYDSLPDGVVLYDVQMQDTFVKGSPSNYEERTIVKRGALGMEILNVGWTQGMAESQGLSHEFMIMLFRS